MFFQFKKIFCRINRAIYKFVLITRLEGLRHNDTGTLLMRNYDLTIESTNTIFSRLCRFGFLGEKILFVFLVKFYLGQGRLGVKADY